MFGFSYLKANPTQYVVLFRNGKIRKAGSGLAFFFFRPSSAVSIVPINSVDVPFIFNEITTDFQSISVQGQLTYRITQPEVVASLLDYSVDPETKLYLSEDPGKLAQRLVNLVQIFTRSKVQSMVMNKAIHASDEIAKTAFEGLIESQELSQLGVEVLTLAILAVKPTPEIARALEAEAREMLLRKADDAIYERRNAAVEQERRIQESELNTEIAIESEKKQLLAARTENIRTGADAQAYAFSATLEPLRKLDPAVLNLLALQSGDPKMLLAKALQELADNAGKIGQLYITPDLLESIINRKGEQSEGQ